MNIFRIYILILYLEMVEFMTVVYIFFKLHGLNTLYVMQKVHTYGLDVTVAKCNINPFENNYINKHINYK